MRTIVQICLHCPLATGLSLPDIVHTIVHECLKTAGFESKQSFCPGFQIDSI